jgi:glycosyltransferase involved in cell wall biosynthesis
VVPAAALAAGLLRRPRLTILAISDAVRRGFIGPAWPAPPPVHLVPLGVDPDRCRPRTPEERAAIRDGFGLPPDAPLVTLVARFQRVKGHDVFIDMATRVAARHPAAQFVVAGEDAFGVTADARFRREVLAQAARVASRAPVRFLGWVDRPERLIAASDVVVCSSRFESFGMVHLEAMASGTPVVSTDVGGPAETLVDGETGWLVPPDRPDLLADRVAALLADGALRGRMGRAGRARVVEQFTVARYAERFADVVDAAVRA